MSAPLKDAQAGSAILTVQVPFTLTRRGGRKTILLPHDLPKSNNPDSTLVKALARAFRWKRMLEAGEVASLADLARRERIAPSYLCRLLRLTFLAPDMVEAILEGAQDQSLTAETLRGGIPDDWSMQNRAMYSVNTAPSFEKASQKRKLINVRSTTASPSSPNTTCWTQKQRIR